MIKKSDAHFMHRALHLARKGKGRVEPNPRVGCVIVKSGKIIAQGYHKKFGGPHAEIDALKKLNFKAKGATMYVTLEPCCHFGKTPPCVDAVIKSGVARVVIGMKDPNPIVNGRSLRKLKGEGIRVKVFPPEADQPTAEGVRQKKRKPYVIVKIAQSIDGKIAARKGVRTQITGKQAFAYVQKLRASVDAILVGANTIRVDDPQLNVRDAKKKQPLRIVLSKSGKVDSKSKIFRMHGGEVIIFSNSPCPLFSRGGSLCGYPLFSRGGSLCGYPLLTRGGWGSFNRLGIHRLLVEGGSQIFTQFFKSNLVDEWHILTAPVVIGEKGLKSRVPSPKSLVWRKMGFVVKQKKMLGKDRLIVFGRRGAVFAPAIVGGRTPPLR